MVKPIISKHRTFVFSPLILPLLSIGLIFLLVFYSGHKCAETKTFSIGSVDPRFNVLASSVEDVAKDAANRLNTQSGKKIMVYNEKSDLKINLVYDDRQAEIDRLNLASDNLEKNRQSVETASSKFDRLLSVFQSDLDAYNKKVSYWNSQGGAPDAVFSQLEKTRADLDNRRNQLTAMSEILNLNVGGYNSDLKNLENSVNSRKNLIITQGLYEPTKNQIEVFTFGNTQELRLVFMHELGHAVGLDHALEKNSIMYYLLENQDVVNPNLTSEDISMINSRCDMRKPGFYQTIFQIFQKNIQ